MGRKANYNIPRGRKRNLLTALYVSTLPLVAPPTLMGVAVQAAQVTQTNAPKKPKSNSKENIKKLDITVSRLSCHLF